MNTEQGSSSNLNMTYEVSGFRSLREFKITLTPGINVLVGPNGSGKTNFIEFLDFLDNTLTSGASAAVSRAGGVARVFSIEDAKSSSPSVSAKVFGIAEVPEYTADSTGLIFNFEYEIEIRFSKSHSAIYISREFLKIKRLRRPDQDDVANVVVGVVSQTRRSPSDDAPPKLYVGARLYQKHAHNPFRLYYEFFGSDQRENVRRVTPSTMPDESVLNDRRSGYPALEAIRTAVTRGRSFNIIPARARQPDDVTRQPFISHDGSGLSATLHGMQSARTKQVGQQRRRRIRSDSLDTVIAWTKLVLPELENISVVQDPHTGKYVVHLSVGSPAFKVSLQSASDGTVKWLAFAALLATTGAAHSIEEPENFLHPRMQQFLIQIIRESLDIEDSGYFIISTHSETLINECKAEELILFRFDGSTHCARLRDPARARDAINETGFGLGYFYASNALS